MNKFKSVKIFHNILQRIDFSYLAEFFRFMGIFVCEEMLTDLPEEKTEAEWNTRYSAYVYVGRRDLREQDTQKIRMSVERYQGMLAALPPKTVHLYDFLDGTAGQAHSIPDMPQNTQKSILAKFMGGLLGTVFTPQDTTAFGARELQDLIDIYVKHQICLHSLNMQYYGRHPSKVVTEAEKSFLAAHNDVKEILQGRKNTNEQYLYDYALLWCQVKTNSACYYNHEITYFTVEKLSKRCRRLYDKYPGFDNALVLLGLSYEPSSSSANEAVAAFMEALREIDDQCFASPVYYWIGKRYEPFRDRQKDAEKSYEDANQHKVKFRNIFKLAIAARDRGDAKAALELFDRISAKLSVKRGMRFTDPLELEYLFKVYYQKAYIYYTLQNYLEAIGCAVKCKNIWEAEINENDYFDALYGQMADDYRNATKERLSIVRVYQMLGECYKLLFDKERAEEYRDRARQLEQELGKEGKIV